MSNLKIVSTLIFYIFYTNCVLCNSSICINKNESCSYQLSIDNSCYMTYFNPTNTSCDREKILMRPQIDNNKNLGYVKLKAYEGDDPATSFNLTFLNISWKEVKIVYFQHKVSKCLTRRFHITTEADLKDKSVYFDCPFAEKDYEGTQVTFLYSFGGIEDTITGRYNFFVPKREHLGQTGLANYNLFAYVDDADVYNLVLRVQNPPEEFAVNEIFVQVFRLNSGEPKEVERNFVAITGGKYHEVEYVYRTFGIPGMYYFNVTPICKNYTTTTVKTPIIYIPDKTTPFRIGMVGVSILIPIVLLIIYMWKKQCSNLPGAPPQTVLLVPYPWYTNNVSASSALVKLLKTSFNFTVLFDVEDIPKTKSKNPFDWLRESFNEATHIVFITSPQGPPAPEIIYQNVGPRAATFMSDFFHLKKKYCAVNFYKNFSLPGELKHLKCFNLIQDLNAFVDFIQPRSFWRRAEDRLVVTNEHFDDLTNAVKKIRTQTAEIKKPANLRIEFVIAAEQDCDEEPLVKKGPENTTVRDGKKEIGPFLYPVTELDVSGQNRESKNRAEDEPKQKGLFSLDDLNC